MDLSFSTLKVKEDLKCNLISGHGAVEHLTQAWPDGSGGRVVVIADEVPFRLHGDCLLSALDDNGIEPLVLTIKPGELSKSRDMKSSLEDRMLASGVDRKSVVLAFGGGVTTDLAGFVASTFMRGIALINLPTTLLGTVDAGIGGKTGLNTTAGKNLVGAFHWPVAVIADNDFLETLPPEEVRCGLAEMVKHGVVTDPWILDSLAASAGSLSEGRIPEAKVIDRAIRVKTGVVSRDPFERGERRILNFGHTAGHGMEAGAGLRIRHGDAVAAGMIIEARIASELTGFSHEDTTRLEDLVSGLGLETSPPCGFDEAVQFMTRDKKGRGGLIMMALPRRLGEMEETGGEWVVEVPPDLVDACWNE